LFFLENGLRTEPCIHADVDMNMSPKLERRKLKVGFILCRSFTLSAFALFVDTLRLASDVADRSGRLNCDWDVLSATGHLVKSSCGIQVAPTVKLPNPSEFDYIAVVGGLLNVEPLDDELASYIRRAAASGSKVIGVCTGSFVLASLGLMQGKTTCVSWLHHHDFLERFPGLKVNSNELFIVAGAVTTCSGGSAVADLAAFLVRTHLDRRAEQNALEILQIERRREGGEVQPRNPLGVERFDPQVGIGLMFMEKNLGRGMTMDAIAEAMGTSRRQMERLFHEQLKSSPAVVYAKLRMRHARMLLLKTSRPLIEIALDVGYDNAGHFARRFKAIYGYSPTGLRKTKRLVGHIDLRDDMLENGLLQMGEL
jgi:transcriptional regulator GlxA family with amidase domain